MKTIIITMTGETLKYNTVKEAKPKLDEIMKQYGKIGYYEAIDREDQKLRIYDIFMKKNKEINND